MPDQPRYVLGLVAVYCPHCGGRGRVRSTRTREKIKRFCHCKICLKTFTVVTDRPPPVGESSVTRV